MKKQSRSRVLAYSMIKKKKSFNRRTYRNRRSCTIDCQRCDQNRFEYFVRKLSFRIWLAFDLMVGSACMCVACIVYQLYYYYCSLLHADIFYSNAFLVIYCLLILCVNCTHASTYTIHSVYHWFSNLVVNVFRKWPSVLCEIYMHGKPYHSYIELGKHLHVFVYVFV